MDDNKSCEETLIQDASSTYQIAISYWNNIGSTSTETITMKFVPLNDISQLEEIKGCKTYSVILKHNTTCPISKSVKTKLEQAAEIEGLDSIYILDLLEHRDISDAIEQDFKVQHESPQLLVVKDGNCTYNEAHFSINAEAIADAVGRWWLIGWLGD